jgi:hypothetical protein
MSEVIADAAVAAPETTTIDTNPPPVAENNIQDTAPSIDDTLSAAWDKAQTGVDRDESGRFKSDKPADPPVENSAALPPEGTIEPDKPAAPVPTIDPPNSWAAEARAHWAKLPPEAQTYIAQRESEAHKAITSYGERLKSYEPLDKVITQFKSDFEKRGLDAPRALATLFEAQRQLDNNPIDGLISIGLSYGIDLRSLLAGQQGALPASDPRVGQVQQEVQTIKQTLEQQLKQQQEQQAAADAAMVKEFAKDKPHFEDVRALMASFMKDGHAETLQDAYDMAVNASPKIRARIQADQRAAEEKKRQELESKAQEEAKRKAADAAKAAKVNVKSGTAHPNPRTMDDTLEEIARRAYG